MQEKLQLFVGDTLISRERLQDLPPPPIGDVSTWIGYLERHAGLISVPASTQGTGLRSYPLWLARHPVHGPILVKYMPGLLNWDGLQCLQLSTGMRFDLQPEDEGELTDVRALVEPYDPYMPMTERRIAEFVLKPVRGLMRTTILHHVVAALCGSVLFIINFNILSYAVPTQNIGNFWAASWLLAAAGVTLYLSLFAAQRAQYRLDSIMEERAEILKLSLLWSLRPQYIASHGTARAEQLCAGVAQAGKASSQALLSGITAIAMLPVLLLMFLRLPTFVFVATLVLVLAGSLLQTWLQLRGHVRHRAVAMREARNDSYLYLILNGIMRLKFYGTTAQELDRWQRNQSQIHRSRLHLAQGLSFVREAATLSGDIAQMLGIFVLSFMIAKMAKEGQIMTVATAFIMLHLVNQIYKTVPRALGAITAMGAIRIDLAEAEDLFEEVGHLREFCTPSVTRASASMECHRLRLPHGCRFKDMESLTIRLDGANIVQVNGDSGAGKTTFLNCLLGLQAPEAGSIEVFGVDPTRLSRSERRRIFSYLDQNVQLLPGTVRDNLKLLSRDTAGDRSLWDALDRVMLLDRVRQLPLGLDTPISDTRRNFSTGERQRMALAQCIAKQSSILVLDEALSGVPKEMELAIFANIRPLFDQIYFVSHREHMHGFAETLIELETRK